MALHKDLSPGERLRVIRSINLKISALLAAKAKLRDRRDTVADLSGSELLLIGLELVRLQARADALEDEKDAFKTNAKSMAPPSRDALQAMKASVEAIHAINVRDRTAKQIIRAATSIAGALQGVRLT